MNDNFENRDLLAKWIHCLFIIQCAGLITIALAAVQKFASFSGWISRGISVLMIFTLFQLAATNKRYEKAAIFQCITVGCALVSAFAGNTLLTAAGSVCSIVASYQEYHGHSEMVKDSDNKLAGKWQGLFIWELVVGLFTGLMTIFGVVIGVLMNYEGTAITSIVLAATAVVSIILRLVYLMYLKKTKALFTH